MTSSFFKFFKGFQSKIAPLVVEVKARPFQCAGGLIFMGSVVVVGHREYSDNRAFTSWMLAAKKEYPSVWERRMRFQIFRSNLREIEYHNRCGKNKALDITTYPTHDEFVFKYLDTSTVRDDDDDDEVNPFMKFERGKDGEVKRLIKVEIGKDGEVKRLIKDEQTTAAAGDDEVLPKEIDWCAKGAVGPVKDQLHGPGACWIFSAVAAVESLDQITSGGEVIPHSDQEVLDCNSDSYDCQGGDFVDAFRYIYKSRGLDTEQVYPYTGILGKCRRTKEKKFGLIDGYRRVRKNDELALIKAVARQPVVAGVDGKSMRFYKKDLFDVPGGYEVTHSILIVGYGTTKEGVDFWLCRNSWSDISGDGGYFKLKRNFHDPRGHCGVAHYAYYPLKLGFNTDNLEDLL